MNAVTAQKRTPLMCEVSAERFGFECHCCGSWGLFERSKSYFLEGERATCDECGVVHSIYIDECGEDPSANASTADHAEDIGQPRCDNSCGLVAVEVPALKEEFLGAPCRWDCELAKKWRANEKAEAVDCFRGAR